MKRILYSLIVYAVALTMCAQEPFPALKPRITYEPGTSIEHTRKPIKITRAQANQLYEDTHINITDKTVFVFDIHGVILTTDYHKIIGIIKNCPNKLHLLTVLYRLPLLYNLITLQYGTLAEQIISNIIKNYPEYTLQAQSGLAIANAQKLMPGTNEIIERLSQNHMLCILSNLGDTSWPSVVEEFPIFSRFNQTYLTNEADKYLKKPQAPFYELFLARMRAAGVNIKDIVFIDDNYKNVIAARAAGIPTIYFTSALALQQILEKLELEHYSSATPTVVLT